MASAGILGVVIGKLRHRKKLYQIILFKVNKGLKVGFYRTILPFGLTVRLWVEGGGESLLNTKKKI